MYIEYSLNGFMRAFFRHYIKFFAVFAVCVALGAYYILTASPIYEARGSFIVKFGANARPDVSLVSNQRPTELAYKDRNEIINSYVKILQSQDLVRKALMAVGVEKVFPSLKSIGDETERMELAANSMIYGNLRIGSSSQSNVIEVFVTNKNPEVAAEFAAVLMQKFVSAQARVYDIPEKDFLEEQIQTTRTSLQDAESSFLDFKEQVGVSSIDEEMRNLLRQKTDLMSIAFKALTEAQQELAKLEAQAAEAKLTYRDDSAVMQRLIERVETAKQQLKKLEMGLEDNIGDDGALANRIGVINDRISYLEDKRADFNQLEKNVDMASKNLEYYTQLFEEARANNVINSHNITRITVVDKPFAPSMPVRPRKKIILAIAILAGGIFGLGLVVLMELLDERFTASDQLAKVLGVPVLVTFDKGGAA